MDAKYEIVVETIAIDRDSLLAGLDYYHVESPAFLDHGGNAQVTTSRRHSLEEFKTICKVNEAVYVYKISHRSDDPLEVYWFRYVALTKKPVVEIVDEVMLGKTYMDKNFKALRGLEMKINLEAINDLKVAWGESEVALQLGQQIIAAIRQ